MTLISIYNGAHSIDIGLDPLSTGRFRNTWEDWCLIPSSRPHAALPEVNESSLEIPGMNGVLDTTDKLHNYPTYGMRSGSWEFHIAHDRAAEKFGIPEQDVWIYIYELIANYLHGQGLRCVLKDDPWWYYDGRFSIDALESSEAYSTITINYNLQPYKWSVATTGDTDWPWENFDFGEGSGQGLVPTVLSYDGSQQGLSAYTRMPAKKIFYNITVNTNPGEYMNIRMPGTGSMNIAQEYIGSAPVCPVIYCEFMPGYTEGFIKVDNSCTGVFTPLVTMPSDWYSSGNVWAQYYERRGYHYIMLSKLYNTAPKFVPNQFYIRAGTANDVYTLRNGANVIPEIEFICPTSDDWVRIALSGKIQSLTIDFRMGRL